MYREGVAMRVIARWFGVSRATINGIIRRDARATVPILPRTERRG